LTPFVIDLTIHSNVEVTVDDAVTVNDSCLATAIVLVTVTTATNRRALAMAAVATLI
jgi:hypothetical protein